MQITRDELVAFQKEAQDIVLKYAADYLRESMPTYKNQAMAEGFSDAIMALSDFADLRRNAEAAS